MLLLFRYSAVQIYEFHIIHNFIFIFPGYITNQFNDQLPVGLLAQLIPQFKYMNFILFIISYHKLSLSSPPPLIAPPLGLGPSTCKQKIHWVVSPPLSFWFGTFLLHSYCYSFDFVAKIEMNLIYCDVLKVN